MYERNRRKRKYLWFGILFLVCLAVAFFLLYTAFQLELKADEEEYGTVSSLAEKKLTIDEKTYKINNDRLTILVTGVDKFEEQRPVEQSYRNEMQSDFLALLTIDLSDKTMSVLHLNRDTMTTIPVIGPTGASGGSIYAQLALAHTFGSGGEDSSRNTVKAVKKMLYDLPVDYFITMTMDAVPILVDSVGGITVDVKEDLTTIDESLYIGNTVTLDGDLALKYVRARYSAAIPTNEQRMQRQQAFIEELIRKVQEKAQENESYMTETAMELGEYMTTNLTSDQLSKYGSSFAEATLGNFERTSGTSKVGDDGYMEFYLDEATLKSQVLRLWCD